MSRFFEKISFEQFENDISSNKDLYDEYKLPKRATKNSAGYDFFAIEDMVIKPGEVKKIPTGYKMLCEEDEMLMIIVRSGMGFKYNMRMTNQVGIIESDYYNNEENEGHMWLSLQNHGHKDYHIKKGDAYAQGIFMKFLTVDNEVEIKNTRKGGLGSTNGKDYE